MYNSPYKNVVSCIKHIYRTEGAYAFYRSYTTQLAMNVPFQSIHFIAYEVAQGFTNPDHVYNPRAHITSGALAGAIAAAATTPLDVCKTLLNTQKGVQVRGLTDAIRKVYRLGGFRGFFRGLQARVLFQIPATAICWSSYESFKYVLRGKQEDGYCGKETEDGLSGSNQNQAASFWPSRFQGVGLYFNKNPPPSVLLEVTTS